MATAATAKMALEIDSYEMIATLEQINGVMISEIEKRARPGEYAQSGFLGPSESLKNVLQSDWKTVQALGTTHIELAAQLRKLWKSIETNKKATDDFPSRVSQLPNNSLAKEQVTNTNDQLDRKFFFVFGIIAAFGAIIAAVAISALFLVVLIPAAGCIIYGRGENKLIQPVQPPVEFVQPVQHLEEKNAAHEEMKQDLSSQIKGEIGTSKGMQEDLFNNDKANCYKNAWNRQLRVENLANNVSLTIGEGVINYIEKYGFYEGGGDQNNYRVDPLKLVAILTGASLSSLQERVNAINNPT